MEHFKASWKLPLPDPLLKRGLSRASCQKESERVLKKETKTEDLKVLKTKFYQVLSITPSTLS